MNIIGNIVSRCHVGTSNRQVIKYVISRLKNKKKTFWALSKSDRRYLMETAIKEHSENLKLYRKVNSGRF